MAGQTWVFLDPDGIGEDWSYVIVQAPTGVTYEQQCGGRACLLRTLEGYLVPIYDEETLVDLAQVFEEEFPDVGTGQAPLPDALHDRLAEVVARFRFWPSVRDEGDAASLRVDELRISELAEAWVPVTTPDGPGVLVWPNSD